MASPGAAGLIGAAVAEPLVGRSDEVIGIDNLNPYFTVSLKKTACRGSARRRAVFALNLARWAPPPWPSKKKSFMPNSTG